MTTDTALVTRIYLDGGHYVRASEGIVEVAELLTAGRLRDGWATVIDPGNGLEKYVRAERALWLEQEQEDA